MLQISPSILSANFANLGADCAKVLAQGANAIHFDVMDGVFVPNITIGLPVLQALATQVPAQYDVHLMIANPVQYVQRFCEAGANWLTFHVEAAQTEQEVLQAIACIHTCGVKAGLAIKPNTPVEALVPYIKELDMVLVMSVEPGFGGQKFMLQAVERIAAVRALAERAGNHTLTINVDGGISKDTAPPCVAAGANMIVAGAAIFGAPDWQAGMMDMRAACAASEKRIL